MGDKGVLFCDIQGTPICGYLDLSRFGRQIAHFVLQSQFYLRLRRPTFLSAIDLKHYIFVSNRVHSYQLCCALCLWRILCFSDSILFNNLYIHGTLEFSSESLYSYSGEAHLCCWCLFMHVLGHFIAILSVLVFKIILLFQNYVVITPIEIKPQQLLWIGGISISCCWTDNGNRNT